MEEKTTSIVSLILVFVVAILHSICFIINILLTIFIIFEWRKRKSVFRSSYFYILVYGYIMVILFTISLIPTLIETKATGFTVFLAWHAQNLLGTWDFALGLNRFTALGFPMLHKKIWNKAVITSTIIFLLNIFPFLLHGYAFAQEATCGFTNFYAYDCINIIAFKQDALASIINASFGTASLILIITGVIRSPKTQSVTIKFEKRLIFQAGFSSLVLILQSVLGILYQNNKDLHLEVAAYYLYFLQFYPGMIILFAVSPILRRGFIKFYRLDCCCCCSKISYSNRKHKIHTVSMYPNVS